jgi:dihydroorotase
MIELYSVKPYKILSLSPPLIKNGQRANITIFDPQEIWTVSEHNFQSKSSNSPFIDWELKGKAFAVINNNQIKYSLL